MSTQRVSRGHLPSYSGDDLKHPGSRGIRLSTTHTTWPTLDDNGDRGRKGLTAKIRIRIINLFISLRKRPAKQNIYILVLSVIICVLYLWSRPPTSTSKQHEPNAPKPPPSYGYKPQSRRASHTYRSDGFLEVNPNGTHPIFDLITRAENDWHKKLRRASATFQEAIEEYVRRYNRPPPKGFDKW